MRNRLIATAAAATLAASLGMSAMPASAATHAAPAKAASAAKAPRTTATAPINQVIPGVGTFVGSFTPTGFTNQNRALGITGTVTGTLTTLAGVTIPVTQAVTTTVTGAQASGACKILNLVLGPLHLNLLGLVIDLNQVVLNITAQPGPGNLLGNLLCAIAGLLDGNGINGLVNILNRLLGL